MVETSQQNESISLPSDLRVQLWRRIDKRLQRGEVLITTDHFQKAMEREFRKLVLVAPTREIRRQLREMIAAVNDSHPETFLSLGIKNAVTKYFNDAQTRMQGHSLQDQSQALEMVSQMLRDGRVGFFLESIGAEVGEKGVSPKIVDSIRKIVDGQRLLPAFEEEKKVRRTGSAMIPVKAREEEEPEERSSDAEEVYGPEPSAAEGKERDNQEQKDQDQLAEREMENAGKYLDSYVKQKLLTADEAVGLRELYSVNERLKKGEIDPEEAERIKGQMDENVRKNLDERLREAVDYGVLYINVFHNLQRIPKDRDAILKFIIRTKQLVMSTDMEVDFNAVIKPLEEDEDLLESAVLLIERKDQEVRMIAANMPPYRKVAGDHENIGNLVIEESFMDDLRSMSDEELSDLLNAEDGQVRVRTAAEMRCILALIAHVTGEVRFHREVRRIKIMNTVRRIYGDASDGKSGRHNVQHFLKRRMPKMYPKMEAEERSALEGRSAAVIDELEGKGGGDSEGREGGKRVYRV
jgi:hypothetical protein